MKEKIALLVFFIGFQFNYAQTIQEENTDVLLKEGITLYQDQNLKRALEYANKGLNLAPDYHDIRVLRIRIFQALNNLEGSREDLSYLLNKEPDYHAVKELAIRQVRLMEFQKGSKFLDQLRAVYNNDPEIELLKAQKLLRNNQPEEARELAQDLSRRNGLTGDQRYQLNNILRSTIKNEIGLSYQLIDFSSEYNRTNWQNFFLEYQHNIKKTTLLGRVTHSDRRLNEGQLYEIEAYPVINDKLYFFGNIGFSSGDLFPDFKSSASVFYGFAKGFEVETGGKMLSYGGKNYFTGILGLTHYAGKFYLNLRAAIGPERAQQMIQNYQFNVRYYFKGSDNYLFTRLSRGISPDESTLFVQVQENPGLEAYFTGLGINFQLSSSHIIRFDGGLLWQEITSDKEGNQVLIGIGYRYRF
ncbi:YaiO family outer membrane beta-barrel protein [Salegentibacter sediminis]|uniref:YaiO family outer membrane beta-barrel protein n=1 Tax=Salegentibacter sediminis TaxID=1930251 RepID=UPI0009BD07E2|nr:YaiO family outer membrane beta-barrel protein [Salegentibacter sediminis]